jgi:hypothetical protein
MVRGAVVPFIERDRRMIAREAELRKGRGGTGRGDVC